MTHADHVRRNRREWDGYAPDYVPMGERAWAADQVTWGIWGLPEAEVGMLPPDLRGLDVVELGCGTAYVSAWLVRRGARVVAFDTSPAQLATAERLRAEHGVRLPLVQADGELTPFRSARFDLAISEYGVCLWCDPYRWVPEAARLLRPGGRLVFLTNSYLMALASPDHDGEAATDRLVRDHFGLHRVEYPDSPAVEFHLPHGAWIDLLHASGFEVERLRELGAAADATTTYDFVTADWAHRWPSEEVWIARRRTP